jgi:O-acetyl-ADP-ribose deacetylase (regulator of RNase III)
MVERLIDLLSKENLHTLTSDFYYLSKEEQFRYLCNIRPARFACEELLKLQDIYLQTKTEQRGIVNVEEFEYIDQIALWQGDITRLQCDAIVNACNERLLGCFQPLHNCIDNVIHTYAGIQVRIDCERLMQGTSASNGEILVTWAYNLPSKYIFHTVGPIVDGQKPTLNDALDLKKCYISALNEAKNMKLKTISFCSIATGIYGYPKEAACKIAVKSVREWLDKNNNLSVVFNVFSDDDRRYYEKELSR